MESIIAGQKVARRRSAPRRASPRLAVPRPAPRARPYPLLLAPAGESARSSRTSLRSLLDALALSLRQAFRSLARRASALPPARLAVLAGAACAAIAAVAALGVAIAQGPTFPLPPSGLLPEEDSAQNLLLDYVSPELADGSPEGDQTTAGLPPVPVALELSTYTVRQGDSLASIAKRFGLYVDTLVSANGISSASAVKTGRQLRIPNINGVIYKVRPGDNLASIAKRYRTDTTRIVDANDLGSSRLVSGMSLFIPGARLPESALKQALGQKVAWPLRGALSSFFGYRADPFTGVRRFHAGIDIVVNSGSPVRAAMDGRVSDAGYNANYGNYIILNHADGFQTLYGHLTSSTAKTGTKVDQGAVIGISGNTGYSTGPHLHFGLFKQGMPLNPMKYLLK